jgi:hypothetical protein
MGEALHPDIETAFTSQNGGIPACIARLATHLSEVGLDAYMQQVQNELTDDVDQARRVDTHFLVKGLKGLDQARVQEIVEPLVSLAEEAKAIKARYQERKVEMHVAEEDWVAAADAAKVQLHNWSRWMHAYKASRAPKGLGTPRRVLMPVDGCFALESPQTLYSNRAQFGEITGELSEIVEHAYRNGALPHDLCPIALDNALTTLSNRQAQVHAAVEAYAAVCSEDEKLTKELTNARNPLVQMLWDMPKSAHWGLFRLDRPDVFAPIPA